jgi:TetR/AcrR family transcriptional regulator
MRFMPRTARRGPGRPVKAPADQRERILEAACNRLADAGLAGVTLREVARHAGVSPSLANYYFLDRAGLVHAIQHERVLPLAHALCNGVRERRLDAAGGIAAFIQQFNTIGARNPWFARLLFLHTPLRQADQIAHPIDGLRLVTTFLLGLVEGAQQSGAIRRDLRAESIAMSLLSLCGFTFAARELLPELLGLDRTPAGVPGLTLHQMAMLRGGLQSPRQESRS